MKRTTFLTTFIYGLVDPETNEIRYVGKSDKPQLRLKEHLKEKHHSKRTHKTNWINCLKIKGLQPKLIIIEEVPETCWENAEIEWIRYYRKAGVNLTNSSDGGEGITQTLEVRNKISKANKGRLLGIPLSMEHRQNISKASLGKKHTEETKKKLSKIFTGATHTEETKKKMSISKTGKSPSVETKQKLSLSKKGKNNPNFGKKYDDKYKKNMSLKLSGDNHYLWGKTRSEETKRKISEKLSGTKSPWYNKKHNEETKKKMSDSAKQRWNSNNEKVTCLICKQQFRVITNTHLQRKHQTTMKEYRATYV